MKTVMLTATGSASAQALVEAFHAAGCRVVGCDLYPQSWNAASAALDAFVTAPPAAQKESYLVCLHQFCIRQSVDVLVPLTDVECDLLCSLREEFAPCLVAVQQESVQRLCRDKPRMAAFLRENELCDTIPDRNPYSFTPSEEDFPLVLKPISGRSSEGRIIIRTAGEYALAVAGRDDYFAQPYLPGNIYTVEVARDRLGHCRAAVREELLRTGNGLGTTVRLHPGHPLEKCCCAIADAVDIVGVVNMEFIDHEGHYRFLELNPRFSGGVGFLIAAGLDYARALLCCLAGEALPLMPELPSAIVTRSIHPLITPIAPES